jgi:hypothetical protein
MKFSGLDSFNPRGCKYSFLKSSLLTLTALKDQPYYIDSVGAIVFMIHCGRVSYNA